MTYPPFVWVGFNLFILAMLALDLFVFHRKPHAIKLKEALLWACFWVGLAVIFNIGLYVTRGPRPALEFLTGYLIEESLSVDNLFVFLLIFNYFRVPAAAQHKVLFWGILGALTMRLGFILAGVALLERFHWIIYLFGTILIVSGIRMWTHESPEIDPGKNIVIRVFRRMMPVTPQFEGLSFFVRQGARWLATPLFVVLLLVETSDLLFAVDSIPAVLAITRDPFIVFSSNAFAVLGLRTLYFALAELMRIFYLLHYGLAAILVFVGAKMVLADVFEIPIGIALAVVALVLAGSIALSIARPRAPA